MSYFKRFILYSLFISIFFAERIVQIKGNCNAVGLVNSSIPELVTDDSK